MSNAALTAKVKNALLIAKGVDASKINVDTTSDGVVTLKGTARTAEMKTLAEKAAKQVAGVKSVRNQLTVAP
jgi:hyperosmotically inducible protein